MKRWCLCEKGEEGKPVGLEGIAWRNRIDLPDGTVLIECHQLDDLQAELLSSHPGALPGLEAPVSSLRPELRQRLPAAALANVAPDGRVLNLLRELRALAGLDHKSVLME